MVAPVSSDHCVGLLAGKVALVTGGAQGIGRSIAEHFQFAGAHVCILDRNREKGLAVAAELTAKHPTEPVRFIYADLEHRQEIDDAVAMFRQMFQKLNILVNNAAIEIDNPVDELSIEDFDRMVAVNLRAPLLLTRVTLPLFAATGGAIINIGSIHSTHAFRNSAGYASCKAGLVALSRNLALELAPRAIRVNIINPGYIDTALWDEYLRRAQNPVHLAEEITRLHPAGRRGTPDDIAQAAVYLAGDQSSFITGTQLVVDGGLTVRAHPE